MHETQKVFSESEAVVAMEFEKNIAYFYGAKNPDLIAEPYLKAIQELERLGLHGDDEQLEMSMLPSLKEAYAEVQKQTQLNFNIDKAAHYEFHLIISQAKRAPFELIYNIMKNLYQEIFQAHTIQIHKGAMLRTFLYKYKLSLLNNEKSLTCGDRAIMLSIAKASEQELKKLEK